MEQDKIWDYYQTQSKEGFASNVGRLEYVAKLVGKGDVVLTIGVGDLYLERSLLNKGVALKVLDPSEASISGARANLGMDAADAKAGYSQNIPFNDNMFDAVIMSEVLEHLDDKVLSETVIEVFRVLKKGGRFLGTVPYRETLKNSEVICPSCECVFHKVGHVQSFDENRLNSVLSNEFSGKLVRVWVRFLPSWRILNFRGRIVALIKKILERFGVYSGKSNLIFEATK